MAHIFLIALLHDCDRRYAVVAVVVDRPTGSKYTNFIYFCNICIFSAGWRVSVALRLWCLQRIAVEHPAVLGVRKPVRQPLRLQQIEAILVQVERFAASARKINKSVSTQAASTNFANAFATHFRSRSSSSKSSKYSEPHRQARRPRITMMYVDVTTRKTPVPPPQVIVC